MQGKSRITSYLGCSAHAYIGTARAIETVGPCMNNEVWKVWRGQAYILTLEDVSAVSHRTEREDMVVSQDDHALIATLGDILKV